MVDSGNENYVSPEVERQIGRFSSNPGSPGYAGEDPRVAASIAAAREVGFDMGAGNYRNCSMRPPKNTPCYQSPVQKLLDPRIGTAEKPKRSIW